MQIILHAAHGPDGRHGSPALADHVSPVVHGALDRFGDRITRVETLLTAEGAAAPVAVAGGRSA